LKSLQQSPGCTISTKDGSVVIPSFYCRHKVRLAPAIESKDARPLQKSRTGRAPSVPQDHAFPHRGKSGSFRNAHTPCPTERPSCSLRSFLWSTWVYRRAARVRLEVLDRLIDGEKAAWAPTQPAQIFLVNRTTPFSGRARSSMERHPQRRSQRTRSIHVSQIRTSALRGFA
jgi:hypothetical protein